MQIRVIVARPKGSWKWQDRFAVSEYELTEDGRLVFRSRNYSGFDFPINRAPAGVPHLRRVRSALRTGGIAAVKSLYGE